MSHYPGFTGGGMVDPTGQPWEDDPPTGSDNSTNNGCWVALILFVIVPVLVILLKRGWDYFFGVP